MTQIYRTAGGKQINIDSLRIANENVIAIGNMKTNARGDELGAGGKVVRTRSQILQDYHKLNTPMIGANPAEKKEQPEGNSIKQQMQNTQKLKTPVAAAPKEPEQDIQSDPTQVKPRGSFAESIVNQTGDEE